MLNYLFEYFKKLFNLVYSRLVISLQDVSAGTLQLTGVVGLAFIVFLYYQLRGDNQDNPDQRPRTTQASGRDPQAAGSTATSSTSAPRAGSESTLPNAAQSEDTKAKSAPAVKPAFPVLGGVRRLTIVAPGILLNERQATQLQEAASVNAEAIAILKEVAKTTDVYVITQVLDDVSEAVVLGALEAAGLIGFAVGHVKPHKVLFCSTLEGKMSIVRQIEPDLHVDSHPTTVDDLKRFIPQLLLVCTAQGTEAVPVAPNITLAPSLAAYLCT